MPDTAESWPDIQTVPPDLETPPMIEGQPAPGRRVRQTLPAYRGTAVYHALYLPVDWQPGRLYPVLAEYAGNGGYKNKYGDISTGQVEGSNLGYGISAGQGMIWICLPFVDERDKKNTPSWWGDVEATVNYCRQAIREVCADCGGDPSAVLLAGFSRGAIACNYIGLHDDHIAKLWRGFVCHSHYDGAIDWGYASGDRPSALERLRRLKGRPQFISHERSVDDTRQYLAGTGIQAPFTMVSIPYRNHCDDWVLRNIPERAILRRWVNQVIH